MLYHLNLVRAAFKLFLAFGTLLDIHHCARQLVVGILIDPLLMDGRFPLCIEAAMLQTI